MRKIFTCLFLCYSALFAEGQTAPNLVEEREHIPFQTDLFTTSFKRMLWVLLAVVILAIITVWILKKLTKIRQDQHNKFNQIKILERRTLSPKSTLYVVEIARKRILISESQLEVRRIETLPHLTELDEEES